MRISGTLSRFSKVVADVCPGSSAAVFGPLAVFCLTVAAIGSATLAPTPALAAEASCSALQGNPSFRSQEEKVRVETGSTGLPDCRAYEMVSPPNKNGALLGGLIGRHDLPMVAESGTNVTAPSDQCFAGPESCIGYRLTEGESYEFTRTPSGWLTTPLAPPAGSYEANSYWNVDANTGTELFSSPGYPGGPESFYGREPNGTIIPVGPLGESKEGIGVNQVNPADLSGTAAVSTADLSHTVYQTEEELWSFDHSEHVSVYEYAGTGNTVPLMVGVRGGPGSHELVSVCNTKLGSGESRSGEAISEDGRTVYFTAKGHADGECPEGVTGPPATWLYARVDGELPDAHTVLISGPAGTGCETPECVKDSTEDPQPAYFEGASSDGDTVVFTDTQQLTDGATQSSGNAFTNECDGGPEPGCNLYESVCAEPCGTPAEAPDAKARALVDISAGATEGGPRVQGVMAISSDGSHVYFVAEGVLTGTEENQEHEKAQGGEDNLYVFAGGRVRFIATLSGADGASLQWEPDEIPIANVTPDGQFLVFKDGRALTGDDTRAEGPAQVYEYDAASSTLKRISIGQDGYDDDGNEEAGNAFIVPAARGGSADSTVGGSRNPTMSEDGELVFFESPVALAPGALGDVEVPGGGLAENVYEYYRGQVYLVPDGSDTTPKSFQPEGGALAATELLGVGESGANVIFSTFDQLVPEDTDTQRDYYDAHVCSEAEPCVPPKATPASCEGEACQGAPSTPPVFGAPGGTATFIGAGNLALPAVAAPPKTTVKKVARCKKGLVKDKRGRCVKRPKKRAKRAGNDRKASR